MVINEIQTDKGFTQDIPSRVARDLVRVGVLVHVQTSLFSDRIHRYFAKPEDAHEYCVSDYRLDKSRPLTLEQESLSEQITSDNSEDYVCPYI